MKTLSDALARLIPRHTKLVLVARGGVRVGDPTQAAAPRPVLIRARSPENGPRKAIALPRASLPAGWRVLLAIFVVSAALQAAQSDATKPGVVPSAPSSVQIHQ